MTAALWQAPFHAQEAIAPTDLMGQTLSSTFGASAPDQQFQAGLFCGTVRATRLALQTRSARRLARMICAPRLSTDRLS